MVLTRYITAEIVKPLFLGVALLIIIFTGYSSAVKLAEAAQGMIDMRVIARLIGLNTIVALEVLLPTALYLSIIAALTRFYRDSEMAAMNAAGVGEWQIIRAIMLLSLLIAALVGAISTYGRPWAYRESYQIEAQAKAEFDIRKIAPGQFIELQDNKYVLHAGAVDQSTGRLQEVFMQTEVGEKLQVVFAEEAYLPPVRFDEPRTFEMFRGYGYLLDRTGGKDSTLRYKKLILHIPIEEPDKSYRRKAEPTINLFKSDAPKDIAEFQWRVSTPLATMLLALLAVPLSRTAPRQGRHAGFFVAILIYVGLFNAISVARNWVEDGVVGRFPGLWWVYLLPALLFAILVATPYWTRRKKRT